MGPLQIVFVLLLCLVPLPLSDALAYGWGKNDQAQLGMGHFSVVTTPTSIPYFSRVVLRDALTATNYIIFMADNGTAYGSGLQYYGQFATGMAGSTSTPILCPFLNRSLDIVLPGTSCNANFNTNLLGWGNVAGHVLGRETGLFPRIQVALPALRFDGKVLSVHSVQDGVIVRLANNTVWAAGNNGGGRLSIGSTTTTYKFVQVNFWRTVSLQQIFSSQSRHACALSTSRSLYCWGSNELGQLGTRDTTTYTIPTLVSFFDENHLEVYKVVFGDVHTIVLTCGGKVYSFGANTFGQLGFTKSTGANSTPRLVNVGNISDIVSGMYQTYARRSDNRWFVWGGIANGGLGLAGANDIATPTEHTFLRNNGINRIRGTSQSLNFIGYEDDSVNNDKLSCPVLVDECVRGTHSCHANATCTDLERGHSCSCKEGYIGDGYLTGTGCARDNSCASRQDYCDENAQCFDTANDGPFCVCNPGFDGDGTAGNCIDIDECEFSPCGANAECMNTAPMYYCECYPNYFGDPYYEGCVLLCDEGKYAHYNSCISCPPGSFTTSKTATFCTPCPVGTYSSIEGLGSLAGCIPCGTGGYAGLGARYCSLCVHGYTNDPYVPHEDNSTCFPCPLGTYGYYGQCYPCIDGQYSIEPAAKRCNSCPPGHFVSGTSSLECQKCPAGHRSIGGTAACAVCPTGFYSTAGSTDCLKCPPGTSTNGTAGQETCYKCPVGRFAARSAVPNCFDCAAGYYADEEGTTTCKRCPSGTFSNPGSSECTPCEAGMYAANSAPTKCLKCESGSKSSPDGTGCIPCNTGEYFSSTTKDCELCGPGTFSNVVGSSSCTKCSAGTYTSTNGATICKQCPVNTYSNTATGFASCASCPAGKTSSGGASSCS